MPTTEELRTITISNNISPEDLRVLALLVQQHGKDKQIATKIKKSKSSKPSASKTKPTVYNVKDGKKTIPVTLSNSLLIYRDYCFATLQACGKGGFATTRGAVTFSYSKGNLSVIKSNPSVIKVLNKNKDPEENEIKREIFFFEKTHRQPCLFINHQKNSFEKKILCCYAEFGRPNARNLFKETR